MGPKLTKLLAEANDFELCDGLYLLILERYGNNVGPTHLPKEEQTVLLVWHSMGVIGNGGFNYLFEADLPGDPDYSRTARAYQRIGCQPAVEAFRHVFELFPESEPPRDVDERVTIYRGGDAQTRGEIDRLFFKAHDEIVRCLARYIRDNAEWFGDLEGARPEPTRESPSAEDSPHQLDPVAVGIEKLPHWARVAFAARCARLVFRYFDELWPDAIAERRAAVNHAFRLAEDSAAHGRAADGVEEAMRNALQTAGAALAISLYGYPGFRNEPGPSDGNTAVRVANVAKASENAARAAASEPAESAGHALTGYGFAREVAWVMEPRLVERIAKDFRRLKRAARRGGWSDRTPVPPSAFTSRDDSGPEKPWWKFW